MIGDTTHDVIMAHRYGCDAAAMTYGASTLQDLIASKPAVLCPDVRALAEYLGVSELVKDVDFTR
jgi:phosphoglycolate phosphatase